MDDSTRFSLICILFTFVFLSFIFVNIKLNSIESDIEELKQLVHSTSLKNGDKK